MMLRNVFSRKDIKYLRKNVSLNILMHAFLTLIIKDCLPSIVVSLKVQEEEENQPLGTESKFHIAIKKKVSKNLRQVADLKLEKSTANKTLYDAVKNLFMASLARLCELALLCCNDLCLKDFQFLLLLALFYFMLDRCYVTQCCFLLLISSFLMLIAFERRCMKKRRKNENSIRKINGKVAFTINPKKKQRGGKKQKLFNAIKR